jgi:hypothetical protein
MGRNNGGSFEAVIRAKILTEHVIVCSWLGLDDLRGRPVFIPDHQQTGALWTWGSWSTTW